MIGTRIKYRTPKGETAQVLCYDERSDLPVYDIEIVKDGEVVHHFEVQGNAALEFVVAQRRWRAFA
jgi:hypothetical protein